MRNTTKIEFKKELYRKLEEAKREKEKYELLVKELMYLTILWETHEGTDNDSKQ